MKKIYLFFLTKKEYIFKINIFFFMIFNYYFLKFEKKNYIIFVQYYIISIFYFNFFFKNKLIFWLICKK
jgi:hypothetical protein